MFKNYFKILLRNLTKGRTYSLLNIGGLSAGLTCFALIALWVSDELSYDKFNINHDRIFRLTSTAKTETGIEASAVSSAPMAKALKEDYPEVENAVRLRMREEIITKDNQQFLQPGILLTDPSFFDVFTYKMTRGNQITALKEPYSIILTESSAKKYFGDEDPLGQTLRLNMYDSSGAGASYTVTGIMPDPPTNAHFTFTMLASFKTIEVARPDVLTIDGWGDASFYTYLLLKKGVDYKAFSNKISQFYGKYIGDLNNIWKSIYFYQLQPLRDIHLRSDLQNEIAPTGSISQVYVFCAIGVFILLLAGINYTNLATARSINRAREVGIKKVAGAHKGQLVMQYLLESVFTTLIALLASFVMCALLAPLFYQVTGKNISLIHSGWLVLFLFFVAVVTGMLSGIYPALILSSFKPIVILRGSFKSGEQGVRLRKILVVSQFVITIVLITGIIIIQSQMSFINHKELGYNKDALVFLRVNGNSDVVKGYDAFKNELQASSLVSGITTSNSMIIGGLGSGGAATVDAQNRPLQVNTSRLRVDTNYFDVYGIKLLAGRSFSRNPSADTVRQIVLNETAVKRIGWKSAEAAIGRPFKMGSVNGTVVGVVSDFHFNSLEQLIEPLAIYPEDGSFSRITVKVDMKNAGRVIALIRNSWNKHFPSALFDFDFVSQQVKEQYRSEERFSKVFLGFSFLSLLIACLGLYGLISFSIVQRAKEIGIRRVLGATIGRVALLLSGSLVRLVLLACVIAVPIAWYAMNRWLLDFAYRIDLSWWMFVAAGVLVLLFALLTIGMQSVKAAMANPVKNLRSE